MSEYDKGYAAGKADALNFFPPASNRKWSRGFRDGYSDGYFDNSRQRKVW